MRGPSGIDANWSLANWSFDHCGHASGIALESHRMEGDGEGPDLRPRFTEGFHRLGTKGFHGPDLRQGFGETAVCVSLRSSLFHFLSLRAMKKMGKLDPGH